MTTKELFKKIQEKLILDLKEGEVRCPQCKGMRFYLAERNGRGFVETCRHCHTGRLYVCKFCGKENKTDYCDCFEARRIRQEKIDKSMYNKAEKLTPSEYDGWIYADGYGCNEGYFESVDDLVHYCEDEEEDIPEWVYCCTEQSHTLDIDSAIELMCEDAFEDAEEHIRDKEELIAFVDQWNAKQELTSYCVDYKRVLILTHLTQERRLK